MALKKILQVQRFAGLSESDVSSLQQWFGNLIVVKVNSANEMYLACCRFFETVMGCICCC